MTFDYWRARCKVEEGDGCLVWAGGVQATNGRPVARVKQKRVSPQREVFQLRNGPIPQSHLIFLKCRNPLCMTVDHMEALPWQAYWNKLSSIGELKRGAAFAIKGRNNAIKRKATKLKSLEEANAIRNRIFEGHCKSEVALQFGISRGYVNKIVSNKAWRDASPWAI